MALPALQNNMLEMLPVDGKNLVWYFIGLGSEIVFQKQLESKLHSTIVHHFVLALLTKSQKKYFQICGWNVTKKKAWKDMNTFVSSFIQNKIHIWK